MAIIARHRSITGRVQGVFFRAWSQEQADELGVNGWIRNCPDGHVEAHVEGEEAAVEQMIERCGEGPPPAQRRKYQSLGRRARSSFDGFELRP